MNNWYPALGTLSGLPIDSTAPLLINRISIRFNRVASALDISVLRRRVLRSSVLPDCGKSQEPAVVMKSFSDRKPVTNPVPACLQETEWTISTRWPLWVGGFSVGSRSWGRCHRSCGKPGRDGWGPCGTFNSAYCTCTTHLVFRSISSLQVATRSTNQENIVDVWYRTACVSVPRGPTCDPALRVRALDGMNRAVHGKSQPRKSRTCPLLPRSVG